VIPVLVGNAADARGLSLAGVDARVCTTREEVERTIDDVRQGEGLVILFSESAATLISDRIAAWRRDGTGPPFVILPR
jgi:vacuolar-type H+-ATPase subunit F/Vma7